MTEEQNAAVHPEPDALAEQVARLAKQADRDQRAGIASRRSLVQQRNALEIDREQLTTERDALAAENERLARENENLGLALDDCRAEIQRLEKHLAWLETGRVVAFQNVGARQSPTFQNVDPGGTS